MLSIHMNSIFTMGQTLGQTLGIAVLNKTGVFSAFVVCNGLDRQPRY